MYVAVKGGERAIDNAHGWLAEERRGDPAVPELTIPQIREQMRLAVNRVMSEGSLYDPDLAALAIKQARGDLIEAIFLLRAYRTTLPRFGSSLPLNTEEMAVTRRVSATFKDLPGGQVLGPTFDYTHRLLDFALMAEGEVPAAPTAPIRAEKVPHVMALLDRDGLIEAAPEGDQPIDMTRVPMEYPADRALRLQAMTRGDEGFMLGLAYSTQRGYGLAFGHSERKAMAMSLVDRALRADELGEAVLSPAQMPEFVLSHSDSLEASGFVQHLKLPHYVDFQAELELVRKMRAVAATQVANTAITQEEDVA